MLKYIFVLTMAIILATFAGCGGSDNSSGSVPVVPEGENTGTNQLAAPENTNPADTSGTGTFSVTVNIPGSTSENIESNVIPYRHYTLRVEITGENITGSIVETLNISSSGEHHLEISNVPAGLNIATIQVLNSSGQLLAQRKHGFYMMNGEAAGPEGISMGVGIDSSGNCNPQDIDIPVGTTLYFENQDYSNARTVSMNSGNVTIGPIDPVKAGSPPDNPEEFSAEGYTFNTPGIYTHDGCAGRVLVYGKPSLYSVDDGDSESYEKNRDERNPGSYINFTLSGNDFGSSRSYVDGEVSFIDTDTDEITSASISSWNNNSITGTVALNNGSSSNPIPKKYLIKIKARDLYSSDDVYYYKGGWEQVGNSDVTSLSIKEIDLYVHDGYGYPKPMIAYKDSGNNLYLSIMDTGNNWYIEGGGIIASGVTSYYDSVSSFSLSVNGVIPYIAYLAPGLPNSPEPPLNDIYVRRYSNNTWEYIGGAINTYGNYFFSPDLCTEDTQLYISYLDNNNSTIKFCTFNGSSWPVINSYVSPSTIGNYKPLDTYVSNNILYGAFTLGANNLIYVTNINQSVSMGGGPAGGNGSVSSHNLSLYVNNDRAYIAYNEDGKIHIKRSIPRCLGYTFRFFRL